MRARWDFMMMLVVAELKGKFRIAQKQKDDHAPLELMLSVERILDLYKELLNRTVWIIQPLRQMPYGNEFYIADPDGNVIAFFENTN